MSNGSVLIIVERHEMFTKLKR